MIFIPENISENVIHKLASILSWPQCVYLNWLLQTISNRSSAGHIYAYPGSKVYGINMGPTWGRQDPGGPHVFPMNLAIWEVIDRHHDDVIKWKHFPRNWPFVRGIHRSPVNSPHKGQWRGALMFTLICARINGWVNTREAGDLRRYRPHYDVIVMDYHDKVTTFASMFV